MNDFSSKNHQYRVAADSYNPMELDKLSKSCDDQIRLLVAGNKYAYVKTLKSLVEDTNKKVRKKARAKLAEIFPQYADDNTNTPFKEGDRVSSHRFGEGVVDRLDSQDDSFRVDFGNDVQWYSQKDPEELVKKINEVQEDCRGCYIEGAAKLGFKEAPKFKEGDIVYLPGVAFAQLKTSCAQGELYYGVHIFKEGSFLSHEYMKVNPEGFYVYNSPEYPSILTLAEAALLGIKPPPNMKIKKKVSCIIYYTTIQTKGKLKAFNVSHSSEASRNTYLENLETSCYTVIDTFERNVDVEIEEEIGNIV